MARRTNEQDRLEASIAAVKKNGWLLVFPIPKKKFPLSVWQVLHPRSEMRWEWTDSADDKVVQLWHLRREIEDGAFPSLSLASTRSVFEELTDAADRELDFEQARDRLDRNIADVSFRRALKMQTKTC